MNLFWNLWEKLYLPSLVVRKKKSKSRNFEKRDVVLVIKTYYIIILYYQFAYCRRDERHSLSLLWVLLSRLLEHIRL